MDRSFVRMFVILLMFGLSLLCFCSAIFTKWAHRNHRLMVALRNERLRRIIVTLCGALFFSGWTASLVCCF